MRSTVVRTVPVVLYLSMILLPLLFAVDRLMLVTGSNPVESIFQIDEHPFGSDAVKFTFVQAFLSAILTLLIGLPIAWWLGRYQWKHIGIVRAALTLSLIHI